MRTALISLAAIALTTPAAFAGIGADLAGDYTGWLYFTSGEDMPIRLHLAEREDGALEASMDNPVLELGGIPTTVDSDGASLTLTNPDVVGFKVVTTLAPLDQDTLHGRITWTAPSRTLEGDIWFHRTSEPLPWVAMEQIPDASGVYPLAPDRAIIISRRSWGELTYTDTRTSATGYLLPQSPTEFLVGDRQYVATTVTAKVRLLLDEGGSVTSLVWQDKGGAPLPAARTAFAIEDVSFEHDGLTFNGEITRLPGKDAQPGIVVIGGSDWRTAEGMRRFANIFASFGLTVLTFDKRGAAGSTDEPDAAFADIAGDIVAGARMLAAREDVLDEQVGVFGYSRGGWHIPLASTMSDDLAFAVMFVPPAVSPATQEHTRRMQALRDSGVTDPADLALAEEYLGAMWEFARMAENGEQFIALRDAITERGWADALGVFETLEEDEWRWARLNMHYDPIPALQGVRCPILAVFGGADTNVTPAQNRRPMQDAFTAGGVADATCIVIDNADHGLRIVEPDGEQRRFHNGGRQSPEVWPAVYKWLTERIDLPGR